MNADAPPRLDRGTLEEVYARYNRRELGHPDPLAFLYGRHWPSGWKHVVFWAGLKGSIPLALVLGLPLDTLRPLREFLVPVVFGVVLVSLLLQGLTIPALIGAVDVGEAEPEATEQGD